MILKINKDNFPTDYKELVILTDSDCSLCGTDLRFSVFSFLKSSILRYVDTGVSHSKFWKIWPILMKFCLNITPFDEKHKTILFNCL